MCGKKKLRSRCGLIAQPTSLKKDFICRNVLENSVGILDRSNSKLEKDSRNRFDDRTKYFV